MSRETILVVDDEADILKLIEYNLTKAGYSVTTAMSGEAAISMAIKMMPNAVILDLMLPGMDGLDVCRSMKKDPRIGHIPIVMLTAKGEEADVVVGLEMGADDYVSKPFSPRVLLARVKAVLRRASAPSIDESETLSVRDIVINPGRHEVIAGGKQVELTHTEFLILHLLARRPGWVFTRQQIIDAARASSPVTERSVDVHITGLRKKLETCGDYIETVRGVGYRFKE